MRLTASLLFLAIGLAIGIAAQTPPSDFVGSEPKSASKPAPRSVDGHADLNGYWKGSRNTKPVGNIAKDLPGLQLPFTAAGAAAYEYNQTKTIDPEALCIIGGVPRHSASGLPFMILQTPKAVAFLYFYSYYRVIPIDGRKHSEDPDPSFFGEEIGWWEGDTLVIDSIGFKDEKVWLDENAHPHSDQLHSVERWTRVDADHLSHEVTIDDPKFYTKPFKYTRTFLAGQPGQQLGEYSCSENNVDLPHLGFGPGPIRPDGSRGYIDPAPLPPLPAPVKTPDEHKQFMDEAQDLKEDPRDALAAKSRDKAATAAAKLVLAGQREQQYWTKAKVPDALQLATENLAASRDLTEASKAGQWDRAGKAFARLESSCRACHDLHPEKRAVNPK